MAFVVLSAIPLYIIIYLVYNRLNKKYLRKNMEDAAELESQLVESINASATIKLTKKSAKLFPFLTSMH